jgi:large subunit ribosomal protein L4
MNADVYSLTGKKISTFSLPDSVFNQPASPALLAQAVRVYLSNQRQGTKGVKTRAQVNYSTRKLWRQKGTGRARHGSRKAPIFVGGGVAHGPTGLENYHLKLTKKMRLQALLGALSAKAQAKEIGLLDDTAKADGKTKSFAKFMDALNPGRKSRVLLILDQPYPAVLKAIRNLPNLQATQVTRLHTFEVLNHTLIILTKDAVLMLAERHAVSGKSKTPLPPPAKVKSPASQKTKTVTVKAK